MRVHPRSRSSRLYALGAILLLPLTLLLLIAGGCVRPSAPSSTLIPTEQAVFVSEADCHACHADICRKHTGTRHAHTLHLAEKKALGDLTPPPGEIADTPYRLDVEGEKITFGSTVDAGKRQSPDFALGSGKLAMTYVSLKDNNTLIEMRMSWFPSKRRWYVTPGQESMWEAELGHEHSPEVSHACLSCHSVIVPEGSLRPEERFFGVGCQSCHGPASTHLAAARAGKLSDLHVERIGTWGAARINAMCGKCHKGPQQVGTSGNEVTMTQRFQPYGLMQSPCFQKSGDRLSCLSCHDPHTNVSTDRRTYEKACLNCHRPTSIATAATPASVPGKPCPVNPREKCVECHMPTRKVFSNSQLPIAMADHLIWAYRKK
jgi:hypothetical protein